MQVWDNVSFADNYFQTVPNLNGNTLTPAGRDIPSVPDTENSNDANASTRIDNPTTGWPLNPEQGDLLGVPNHSVRLGANAQDADNYQNSRAGFTKDIKGTNPLAFFFDGTGAVHGRVNSWYAGTSDFDLTEFADQIYRRRGDGFYEHLFDSDFYNLGRDPRFNPWYTPDFLPESDPDSFKLGAANAPWEGIGTGWFYSAQGGGIQQRPRSTTNRVPVEFDNTYDTRMRGDFAVPTLFNGNFDAVTKPDTRLLFNKVPGWSNHFNDEAEDAKDLTIDKLVEWSKIPNLDTYRDQVGYDPKQPNYALKLDGEDKIKITHNNFVVPDWGALRFDLYVPNPGSGDVRVFLNDRELQSSAFQGLVRGDAATTGEEYPAVDLREFDSNIGARTGEGQFNRIGFAKQGFQTFQVDIPNELRGKIATLKFEVNGEETVFLDNVFFKSQHLSFGNPNLTNQFVDNQEARKDIDTPVFDSSYDPFEDIQTNPSSKFFDNYLIEKPQYSLSYNDNLKTPNWVSYQLNKSWLGSYNIRPSFGSDPRLPFDNPAKEEDIPNATNFQRGHMTTASHRSRNKQDYVATYLMSNIIPQPLRKPHDRWTTLERWLTDFVNVKDKEFYIISGRDGQATDEFGVPLYLNNKISVPKNVWKLVLVSDKAGQGISDVNENTLAFAVRLPNTLIDYTGTDPEFIGKKVGQDPDNDWTQKIINIDELESTTGYDFLSIDELESTTGYDFLSNIPTEIQNAIERRGVGEIKTKINSLITEPASLLADEEELSSISILGTDDNSSIRHNSVPNHVSTPTENGRGNVGISEIGINQDSIIKSTGSSSAKKSRSSIHVIQDAASEIGFMQTTPVQINGLQVGISNNSFLQESLHQNSTSQVSTSQVSTSQVGVPQASSAQVNIPQTNSFEIDGIFREETFGLEQLNSSKISLPVTIANDQFFSGDFPNHNSTPEIINALNNSATNIWSDLLKSPTSLDIDFQITDLPKGQLAEATITGFDDSGKPNAGTIFIDHNANGVGWFIDETPLNNSEFTAQNTDNYLLAAAESEAEGKYDLLTTVLHELSHLYGFIDGYEGFDSLVSGQREKGKGEREQSDTFTPYPLTLNQGEALSFDGEHLDKQAHPYDLLNTHLCDLNHKLSQVES